MKEPAKPTLLYDDDCGICNALARMARKIDHGGQFDLQPFQGYDSAVKQALGLSEEDFQKGLYLVSADQKRVHQGVFALNRFCIRFWPFNVGVVLLYVIPILLLAEIAVYALVARNRGMISRWLGLGQCRLPNR